MADSTASPASSATHPLADGLAALTERERDVLRRLTTLSRPPEIARELGIGEATVRTHIANARRKLGGVGAFAAARALAESEGRHQSLPTHLFTIPGAAPDWRDLLPVRRKGAHGNDLNLGFRLIWIVLLASGIAIAFGMLAVGARVLSDLLRSLG
jgi:DNA-binding CsgD family transcriptional regulator